MHQPKHPVRAFRSGLFATKRITLSASLAAVIGISSTHAQSAPADTATSGEENEVVVLSPFTVSSSRDRGYQAADTLAGTRIRTDLADVGSAISVVTKEFLQDIGATDNESLLAYVVGTEVGGPRGNFSGAAIGSERTEEQGGFGNPNANTRVRGLTAADNTRNYFLTDVPWDGYNVSRVDLQRGPNAILFGLGSPAGVVNATTDQANLARSSGSVELRYDQFGSKRASLNYNHVLIPQELAIRVALLGDYAKFRQDPAFEDDERVYGAVTYRPRFLNNRASTLQISANFEHGEIDSNRPRFVAPIDQITPFFVPKSAGGQGGQTFNHYLFNNATTDPNFNAWLAPIFELGPRYVYNGAGQGAHWVYPNIPAQGALDSAGRVVGVDRLLNGNLIAATNTTVWGRAFSPFWIENSAAYAQGEQLPFYGIGAYDAKAISDPAIFDFYNKLLDGPNKHEFSDWDTWDASLSQTFFENRLGYDVTFHREESTNGQTGILSWWNRIKIDVNEVNADDTLNPNVGRAYVEEEAFGGNRLTRTEREAFRAQIFGEYDFRRNNDGVLGRLLGKHRLTGVAMEDNRDSELRTFQLRQPDQAFTTLIGSANAISAVPARINTRYYISGDLRGASLANGLHLDNIQGYVVPAAGSQSIRYFDTTWIAPASVSPGDPWSPGLGFNQTQYTRQSQNPANYRGWTTGTFNLIDPLDGTQASLDYSSASATLNRFNVDSLVAVWQGHLWNDSIVLTYGWREDKSQASIVTAPNRADGHANVDPTVFNYDAVKPQKQTVQSRNWSAVTHLHRLLGRDRLPLNVSLFYNEGESFQPSAGRTDFFNDLLPPPDGTTTDYGVLLATKDNKYSLRVTKYETEVKVATLTRSLSNWFQFEQAMWSSAETYGRLLRGELAPTGFPDAKGGPDALVNVVMPAYADFLADLNATFPKFGPAAVWQGTLFGPDGPSSSPPVRLRRPATHVFTENSLSKGVEIEFTANPLPNWRVAINASKTQAIRDEVPGQSLVEFLEFIDDRFRNTPAGDMPIFSQPNNPQGVFGRVWAPFWGQYSLVRNLNGQQQPEIREWRANIVTNYSFDGGFLRGVGVGGAFRYEDGAIYDYAPMVDANGVERPNLAEAFSTGSETRADLWLSYNRRLTDKINWRIQLNVYNAFGKNKLIPLNAQPDGTSGAMRIQEGRSWAITSSFTF